MKNTKPRMDYHAALDSFLDYMEEFPDGVLLTELLRGKKSSHYAANDGLLLMRLPDKNGNLALRSQMMASVDLEDKAYYGLNVPVWISREQNDLLEGAIAQYTKSTSLTDVGLTHVKVKIQHFGENRHLELVPSYVVVDDYPRPWLLIRNWSVAIDANYVPKNAAKNHIFQETSLFNEPAFTVLMEETPALETYYTGSSRWEQKYPIPRKGPITFEGKSYKTIQDLFPALIASRKALHWYDFLQPEALEERATILLGGKTDNGLTGLRYFIEERGEKFDEEIYLLAIMEQMEKVQRNSSQSKPKPTPVKSGMLGSI